MSPVVIPSYPAPSFEALAHLANCIRDDVGELQVDIVDGQFVPPVSWPFTEADPISALSRLSLLSKDFLLEIDCMIERPERFLDTFLSLNIARVVIHAGSTNDYFGIFKHAEVNNYKVGLAILNSESVSTVEEYIDNIDFLQVMGIAEIGKQGQPFDTRTLETLRIFRSNYPELELAVDGSVNKDTIKDLVAAGATRLLPGSAITKADNPQMAYKELKSLVQK